MNCWSHLGNRDSRVYHAVVAAFAGMELDEADLAALDPFGERDLDKAAGDGGMGCVNKAGWYNLRYR